jgi:hypothetical protein
MEGMGVDEGMRGVWDGWGMEGMGVDEGMRGMMDGKWVTIYG